jgi:hypothetical protein
MFYLAKQTNYYRIDNDLYKYSHLELYYNDNLKCFDSDNFSGIPVFCLTLYNSLTFLENGGFTTDFTVGLSSISALCHLVHQYRSCSEETGFN